MAGRCPFPDRHLLDGPFRVPLALLKRYRLNRPGGEDLLRWSEFFATTGYRINEMKEPGVARLSRQELDRLREVALRNVDSSDWDVTELTHEFDEWKRNNPGKSSRPIPLEHIVEAVGRAQDMESILEDEKDRVAYDHLFGE